MELDENGSPQLAAAENYTVSPDGLTYTFTLKSDRFWFYDANADDVVDDDELLLELGKLFEERLSDEYDIEE